MALERIDPIRMEDYYVVDHLLRYVIAAPYASGNRVLDAACGLGFGSVYLLHHDASEVVGMDNSPDAINVCKERWAHENLNFLEGDILDQDPDKLGKFKLITSFETLEHVENPARAIRLFNSILESDGILIGSVPGRNDLKEENPFHLHHFNQRDLMALLEKEFKDVQVYRQDFSIKSSVVPISDEVDADSIHVKNENCHQIDFGKASTHEDSYFFIASNRELIGIDISVTTSSRNAWLLLRESYQKTIRELESFSGKYTELFQKHGDLKVKFTKMLGWGKWHYEQLNGEELSDTAMERILNTVSKREEELARHVDALHKENQSLKKRTEELESFLREQDKNSSKLFENGARLMGTSE